MKKVLSLFAALCLLTACNKEKLDEFVIDNPNQIKSNGFVDPIVEPAQYRTSGRNVVLGIYEATPNYYITSVDLKEGDGVTSTEYNYVPKFECVVFKDENNPSDDFLVVNPRAVTLGYNGSIFIIHQNNLYVSLDIDALGDALQNGTIKGEVGSIYELTKRLGELPTNPITNRPQIIFINVGEIPPLMADITTIKTALHDVSLTESDLSVINTTDIIYMTNGNGSGGDLYYFELDYKRIASRNKYTLNETSNLLSGVSTINSTWYRISSDENNLITWSLSEGEIKGYNLNYNNGNISVGSDFVIGNIGRINRSQKPADIEGETFVVRGENNHHVDNLEGYFHYREDNSSNHFWYGSNNVEQNVNHKTSVITYTSNKDEAYNLRDLGTVNYQPIIEAQPI
ncbi:hypothetical protein [Luteibaculum oceani]|uniref:Uncharacterized protein n=1 Tax=Luteibaculum oceani TaxID=1294296 RepID=A0A5C6USK0_9FLAO|nr:hypothetical protein [Luteibaculum oceani]TXC75236.1 hypothetical protein FRX97_12065 [Luteibaculum oceani]